MKFMAVINEKCGVSDKVACPSQFGPDTGSSSPNKLDLVRFS